jgi:hypothetical protein
MAGVVTGSSRGTGIRRFTRAAATGGVLALLALVAELGSPAPASAHGMCRNVYGGDVIVAHNLSCRKARRIVRTWGIRYRDDGIVDRTVLGFRCRGTDDPYEGLTMRCRRGSRVVRFYANAP